MIINNGNTVLKLSEYDASKDTLLSCNSLNVLASTRLLVITSRTPSVMATLMGRIREFQSPHMSGRAFKNELSTFPANVGSLIASAHAETKVSWAALFVRHGQAFSSQGHIVTIYINVVQQRWEAIEFFERMT